MNGVTMRTDSNFPPSLSNLGVTMSAALLLAACGGTDAPAPAPDGGTNVGTPTPTPVVPVVQPAWGSMGVLVAPGQASKIFTFANGSCNAGGGQVSLFNASLTVMPNGDVSFKAATQENATAVERFSMTNASATSREARFYANEGALGYIDYRMEFNDYDKYISLFAGEGEGLYIYDDNDAAELYDYQCAGNPVTIASLTPATAFLPSEQRVASVMLAGVSDVGLEQYNDFYSARIVNGVFYWRNFWNGYDSEINGIASSSLNLSNSQLFNGYRQSLGSTLMAAPAPVRVTFNTDVAAGGYFNERYSAANDYSPERKYLYLNKNSSDSYSYEFTRLGNTLYVGNYEFFNPDLR
jgi:hypothetical protein